MPRVRIYSLQWKWWNNLLNLLFPAKFLWHLFVGAFLVSTRVGSSWICVPQEESFDCHHQQDQTGGTMCRFHAAGQFIQFHSLQSFSLMTNERCFVLSQTLKSCELVPQSIVSKVKSQLAEGDACLISLIDMMYSIQNKSWNAFYLLQCDFNSILSSYAEGLSQE